MTEATVKEEVTPNDVKSTKPDITEPKTTSPVAPPSVPSSTTAKPPAPSSPKTEKPVASVAVRRSPAPPPASPAVEAGASRAAKSKKKKGSGGGAAGAGENTGRWTAEEHRLFLQGLEQHGKGWKKIASLIKSRTVVQIRTHAQKYFQKLAKARQNGEEGDVSMEGRGGISTLTSAATAVGGQNAKRRRHLTGTKRKAIHSVVSSAVREGKRIAVELEESGVPNPVPPLPAVSPILAHFVLPEAESNRSSLGSATTTSQGTISGPALEDSIFRFLTAPPVSCADSAVNDVARQAGANPITLPSDQPSSAPSVGGEISPTGVADFSLYPSWTDGKDPPSWYSKGADVEALLDVADTLDWLADPGDPNETYQPSGLEAVSSEDIEQLGEDDPNPETEHEDLDTEHDDSPNVEDLNVDDLPEVEDDVMEDQQMPSIFDGAPESSDHLPDDSKCMTVSESAVHLGDSAPEIDEPLFDTPMEEHDFVSTILENESSADLPVLG